ncbi:MAG: hypothetical protein H6698_09590 [Myxococcales bacterium]|nr:hypothetical protein [Myxococcales bacterium]MCB9532632.1 hypothetical protein [Myxococcales bacterium]MCB9534534.1 hypothetical protein [Myxococcales bacterium]
MGTEESTKQAEAAAPVSALEQLLAMPADKRVALRIGTERQGEHFDEIRNRDPKTHYFILDVTGLPATEANGWRMVLAEQGYSPLAGPYYRGPVRAESVVNRPGAELWGMPMTAWTELKKARRRAAQANPMHRRVNAGRVMTYDPYAIQD